MCVSSAGREVFLGCKCENVPPDAGLTREMADEVERRDDDEDGKTERGGKGSGKVMFGGKALKRSV